MRKEFEPCPNILPYANGKILDDEKVIIHSSGLTGEPEVFKPNAWVYLPGVFGDVGGRSETLRKRRSTDALAEGPWPQALRAGAPVIWPAITPGAHFSASLDDSARVRVACYRMADVVAMSGPTTVASDAMSVLVQLVWGRHLVGLWRGCHSLSQAYRLWRRANGSIWLVHPRPPGGERGRGSESWCGAFCLLDGSGLY